MYIYRNKNGTIESPVFTLLVIKVLRNTGILCISTFFNTIDNYSSFILNKNKFTQLDNVNAIPIIDYGLPD